MAMTFLREVVVCRERLFAFAAVETLASMIWRERHYAQVTEQHDNMPGCPSHAVTAHVQHEF